MRENGERTKGVGTVIFQTVIEKVKKKKLKTKKEENEAGAQENKGPQKKTQKQKAAAIISAHSLIPFVLSLMRLGCISYPRVFFYLCKTWLFLLFKF